MIRTAFAALLAGMLVAACADRPSASAPAPVLALAEFEPNPAGPPAAVLDVAGWGAAGAPAAAALYVAIGVAGIDVHRADGSHLQRLGRSPVTRLARLDGVAVDDRRVTLLAGADGETGTVQWFAIDERSGALQRMPSASTRIEGGLAGLCGQRNPESGAAYLVATTLDGHLERWQVEARSERIPGRPHRVLATLERRVALDRPAGECAADPATGELLVIGDGGALLRANLPRGMAETVRTAPLASAPAAAVRDIAWIERADGNPVILALDDDGRGLRVLSAAGDPLANWTLAQAAGAVAGGPPALAVVTAGGNSMQFAPWTDVADRLPAGDATR
jgi:myo-inositol-hexaphosphate 3-phosphohydrolase